MQLARPAKKPNFCSQPPPTNVYPKSIEVPPKGKTKVPLIVGWSVK